MYNNVQWQEIDSITKSQWIRQRIGTIITDLEAMENANKLHSGKVRAILLFKILTSHKAQC